MSSQTDKLRELSIQEIKLIDSFAKKIKNKRLEDVATLFLESHRPLAVIFANLGYCFAPLVSPLFGLERVNEWLNLISRQEALDYLLQKLS